MLQDLGLATNSSSQRSDTAACYFATFANICLVDLALALVSLPVDSDVDVEIENLEHKTAEEIEGLEEDIDQFVEDQLRQAGNFEMQSLKGRTQQSPASR